MVRLDSDSELENNILNTDKTEQSQPSESATDSSLAQESSPAAFTALPPQASQMRARAVVPFSAGRWRRWWLGAAFVLTAVTSSTLGLLLVLLMPSSSEETALPNESSNLVSMIGNTLGYRITRPVNILIMGIDAVPEAEGNPARAFEGRTDTMLLVRVDPIEKTANVLSIPRDTQVYVGGLGYTKVNHANMEGGPELAAQTVSSNLDGVTVDRYIRISTQAFRELVDLLGGVEVNVPVRMRYTDLTQQLEIDLQPGVQILSGAQAEQFARFRSDALGDVGRVQRQQQLLRALKDRLTSPTTIPRIPQAVQIVQTYLDTNLTLDETLALADFALQLDRDAFRMVILPGRFSMPDESRISYWVINQTEKARIMRDFFAVNSVSSEPVQRTYTNMRIAVQNATDDPRTGSRVVRYLRSQGFENVYLISDWAEDEAESQIIAQSGDLQGAQIVESLLGVGRVVSASTGEISSDLTLRIGMDWYERAGDI